MVFSYKCFPSATSALFSSVQVVKATQGRIPVFLDGGVRRGTDVFKALALGASGIFVSIIFPNYQKAT